eukprot:2667605-Rhodomonas_salina.1
MRRHVPYPAPPTPPGRSIRAMSVPGIANQTALVSTGHPVSHCVCQYRTSRVRLRMSAYLTSRSRRGSSSNTSPTYPLSQYRTSCSGSVGR